MVQMILMTIRLSVIITIVHEPVDVQLGVSLAMISISDTLILSWLTRSRYLKDISEI